jgi:hypothetical protein
MRHRVNFDLNLLHRDNSAEGRSNNGHCLVKKTARHIGAEPMRFAALATFRSKNPDRAEFQGTDASELSRGLDAATEPKIPPWALIMARPAA